jgi:small basic protein
MGHKILLAVWVANFVFDAAHINKYALSGDYLGVALYFVFITVSAVGTLDAYESIKRKERR